MRIAPRRATARRMAAEIAQLVALEALLLWGPAVPGIGCGWTLAGLGWLAGWPERVCQAPNQEWTVRACLCFERAQATGALSRPGPDQPSPHGTEPRQPPSNLLPPLPLQPARPSLELQGGQSSFSIHPSCLSSPSPIILSPCFYNIKYLPPHRDLRSTPTCPAPTSRARRELAAPTASQQQDGPPSPALGHPNSPAPSRYPGIPAARHAPFSREEQLSVGNHDPSSVHGRVIPLLAVGLPRHPPAPDPRLLSHADHAHNDHADRVRSPPAAVEQP